MRSFQPPTRRFFVGLKNMNKKIHIGIAGYGVFGAQFVEWLRKYHQNVEIDYIIEPNRHKRDLIKKLGYRTYENIYDVPNIAINKNNIIVDCSPRGEGIKNKPYYEDLRISAIFQNGEEDYSVGNLYYPEITNIDINLPCYLKIPLCSGLSTVKILTTLKENNYALPIYITSYHSKVTNTARNLTFNYKESEYEINKLFSIKSQMNVVYLRGEPHNSSFTYHGYLTFKFQDNISKTNILRILSNSKGVRVENQEIDTLFYKPTTDTTVIKDSMTVVDNELSLATISYTPLVNFPINLDAIMKIASVQKEVKKIK